MKTILFSVPPGSGGLTLLDFLQAKLGSSRRKAKELIDSRGVFVNRKRVWMARHVLKPTDTVECADPAGTTRPPFKAEVLFEDKSCVVIAKPAGILSNGPDSVESLLREMDGRSSVSAVHRLDRDTSGCLLFAKDRNAFEAAVESFSAGRVLKIYHAIVSGNFPFPARTVNEPVDGLRAETRFRRLDANDEASHLQARIETGRTHQIRKHLAFLRFPVLGDRQYGTGARVSGKMMRTGRQMLHASVLEFDSPATGERVRVKAPLPGDFRRCLAMFNLT